MRFAVSTACMFLRDYTEDAIPVIKRMGVDRAEIFLGGTYEYAPDYIEKLSAILIKNGVCCDSIHSLNTQFEPQLFSAHPRQAQSAEEMFRQVLMAGQRLGASCYVMHGMLKLKRGSHLNAASVGPRLQRLGEIAKEYGILLTVENVHWCMASDPRCVEALDPYIDGINLGYTLDVKQAVQSGYAVEDYLSIMGKKLKNVHICGTVLREDGEVDTAMPEQIPGQMENLIDQLRAIGYDGNVVLEVYSRNYENYDELAQSCAKLKAMIEKDNKDLK